MAAVIRSQLSSSLAERYDLEMIVTYGSPKPRERIWTFLEALAKLVRWGLRRGKRLVHIHSAVRGSLYRKSVCVLVARMLRRPVIFHLHAGMGDIETFHSRLDPVRRWLFGRALKAATAAVAVSTESALTMERCFGVPGIVVVPNPAPPVSGAVGDVALERASSAFCTSAASPTRSRGERS